MENLFVSGYVSGRNGGIGVIVKDAKSNHPLIRVKCTKTGTFWTPKGTTLEEAKGQAPVGTDMSKFLQFGQEVQSELGGIFEVVPVEQK